MRKPITYAAFARQIGVSRQSVHQAVQSGKLGPALRTTDTGKPALDPDTALQMWNERVRPRVDAPRPPVLTAEELRQLERGDFDDLGGK